MTLSYLNMIRKPARCVWIRSRTLISKERKRNFVEKGVYGDSYREDEKPILVVSMKAAWNVDETPYIEMSKKYNVDFRVYGYEMGLEFNREIEIVEGRLVTNRRIKFKDYKWECPDPTLGGER